MIFALRVKGKKLVIFVPMTRMIVSAIIILTAIIFLSSCAAPKYGCPSNTMGAGKFRG